MKLLVVTWRDPTNSVQQEQFEAEKVKARTEPGWLKMDGPDGPIRWIPSDKVHLIQFVEKPEEPRIVSPHMAAVPKLPS